jgi:conjugal transfer pilin signal peptidase TrbI
MNWKPRLLRSKKPWPRFIGQCLLLTGLVCILLWLFTTRYEIGIAAGKPCMPGKFFVIERRAGPALHFKHGDIIVFRTDKRTTPYYRPGSRFVKLVRGVPGDHVHIGAAGKLQITCRNYRFDSALVPRVVKLLGKKSSEFTADYTIQPGNYFAMGTYPDSYDSRYWGLVHSGQIVGKGLAVFGQ